MISPEKCERRVQKIHAWVQQIIADGGGDEEILESMADYMGTFKTIMDNSSPREMDAFTTKYAGFYRFSKLLERLAEAIADGRINPSDFEPKKKKPKGKGFG